MVDPAMSCGTKPCNDYIERNPTLREVSPVFEEALRAVGSKLKRDQFFIIAVDGPVAAGKSYFARFLSWELQTRFLDADIFLSGLGKPFVHDRECAQQWLLRLRILSAPLVVVGAGIANTLHAVGFPPNFLIYVEKAREVRPLDDWYTANTDVEVVPGLPTKKDEAKTKAEADWILPSRVDQDNGK